MSKIRDILRIKGNQIVAIHPDATVLDAALLMNDHKIGSVVVSDRGQLVGIFTERDILRRVVAQQYDPARTALAQVMTEDVVCCDVDTPIETARNVMKHQRIRHLPVQDEHQNLLGIISIGDLNAYRLEGQEVQIHMLKEYLYSRV